MKGERDKNWESTIREKVIRDVKNRMWYTAWNGNQSMLCMC